MTHKYKALVVEGQVMIVAASTYTDAAHVVFFPYAKRHKDDIYESCKFKNPTAAMRKILASIEALVSQTPHVRRLMAHVGDRKRARVYIKCAQRLGLDARVFGSGEQCVVFISRA